MTVCLTVGMWLHTLLNLNHLAPTVQTQNPIWGELRLCGALVASVAPWCALNATL